MLDKQIHMYSVDTGHFYSNNEKYLHDMNCKYRKERNYLNNQKKMLERQLIEKDDFDGDIKSIYSLTPAEKMRRDSLKCDLKSLKEDYESGLICEESYNLKKIRAYLSYYHDYVEDIPDEYKDSTQLDTIRKCRKIKWLICHKRWKAYQSKELLLQLLKHKVGFNIEIDKMAGSLNKDTKLNYVRTLRKDDLRDSDIISIFESSLTRTIGIKTDELTDILFVVQIYYFDIFKDLVFFGFMHNGEKYRYLTSSAGQIRKKKAVFIKESVWAKIEKTIMCGLTIDNINKKGGNNVNKHLAYLALSNSATDEWVGFDIDRCIVVDDFETDVYGTFDFIDESDYSIERKTDHVPITHTDGAGMMLPSVMDKNTMFRAPWIKGLLGVFDYKSFIAANGYSPIVFDIYGKEHDVIEEDIQIIFFKSQFKMWKYYDSWDEYKTYFKEYNCQAGRCNTEEDRIKNAKINYQMLQTLTNITDEEIDMLCETSAQRITNICSSEETMKDVLGITPYNQNMTPFQNAVKLYPALLNDTYAKDVLREIKNSLLKSYRSGKLEINGKYTFLLPDFYAVCEHLFGHIENPKGLLKDQEVFCWLFKHYEKLDCLRSPHLYKEHAVRFNVANGVYGDRPDKIRKWFTTNAIYTSSYDLISKILQFDVDGDCSLVVADKDFIRIAERNMNGIVPLYYNMKKADPTILNNENIYSGLNAAFKHGNIGIYSNAISKIWNDEIFINGTDEEKRNAVDCVKLLCMENNFQIDAAKTLYMPDRPDWFYSEVTKFTGKKLPAFFKYAKDKKEDQIEGRNLSFVNKIYDRIQDKKINTRSLKQLNLDYRKLMRNENIVCSNEVYELYRKVSSEYSFQVNMKDEYIDNLRYLACNIRKQFNELGYTDETVADMLVQKIYGGNSRRKQILWFCYGQYIVNNLKRNVRENKTKFIKCVDCGEWIEIDIRNKRTCRCDRCQRKKKLESQRRSMQKNRM